MSQEQGDVGSRKIDDSDLMQHRSIAAGVVGKKASPDINVVDL